MTNKNEELRSNAAEDADIALQGFLSDVAGVVGATLDPTRTYLIALSAAVKKALGGADEGAWPEFAAMRDRVADLETLNEELRQHNAFLAEEGRKTREKLESTAAKLEKCKAKRKAGK